MSERFAGQEGATPLDPDEITGLRFRHIATRGELDELEQANITAGMRWLARQKNPDLLSEKFVRDLHGKLFGEVWKWAGSFRKTEKNIGVDPIQVAILLRQLLDDVRYWIENRTYPPKEIAVRFHHRLVHIHPFPNGNGRFARIMVDAVLTRMLDEPAIDWAGGYSLQEMNLRREAYIAALRAADRHDYRPLLEFVGA